MPPLMWSCVSAWMRWWRLMMRMNKNFLFYFWPFIMWTLKCKVKWNTNFGSKKCVRSHYHQNHLISIANSPWKICENHFFNSSVYGNSRFIWIHDLHHSIPIHLMCEWIKIWSEKNIISSSIFFFFINLIASIAYTHTHINCVQLLSAIINAFAYLHWKIQFELKRFSYATEEKNENYSSVQFIHMALWRYQSLVREFSFPFYFNWSVYINRCVFVFTLLMRLYEASILFELF